MTNYCIFSDPSVSLITESSGSLFIKGDVETFNIAVTLENDASFGSGNNIPAASGSNSNFAFTVHLSDVDLSAGGVDTLGISTSLVTSDDLQQSLDASTSVMISGTADLTTPTSSLDCEITQYLCIGVAVGSGALYQDVDNSPSSNVVCNDISSSKTCDPGENKNIFSYQDDDK